MSELEVELTKDQASSLDDIIGWLNKDGSNRFKVLMGYAGTGKTFLLNEVATHCNAHDMKIAVTATTNKAVKVLKDMVGHGTFMTIHSLLNIKPKRKGGEEIFEPDKYSTNSINNFDIVFVDEASMISKKLLSIIEEQTHVDTKILFCGDPAQLQPVGEDISKCFDYSPTELKSIVRHGDDIAQKAKLLRQSTRRVSFDELIDGGVIQEVNEYQVKELFKSFREEPDKQRVLCWTNKRVKGWNKVLRVADWGGHPETFFVAGDIVMANEPIIEKKPMERIVMLNSEEGEVQHVRERSDSFELDIEKFSGGHAEVRVVKESYESKLQSKLKKLARHKNWREFWKLKEKFHDVRHCYAMTTHKSQGSTFNTIIIDRQDINKNRDTQERNQLVYVALTRASHKVLIF